MSTIHIADSSRGHERGYSLLELTVALLCTTVLVLGVMSVVQGGRKTSGFVRTETKAVKALRDTTSLIANDLRNANPKTMAIAEIGDGNHTVKLSQLLEVCDGVMKWGVYDKSLGDTEDLRTREGWVVKYDITVVERRNTTKDITKDQSLDSVVKDEGVWFNRRLHRRLIDENGVIQQDRIICNWLRHPKDSSNPSFRVEASGSMWKVRLFRYADPEHSHEVRDLSFDVAIRN